MELDKNKAVAREYFQAFNARDFQRRHSLIDPSCTFHGVMPEPMNASRHAQFDKEILVAWPDHEFTIEDVIAEGDRVAVRLTGKSTHSAEWFGIPATGRAVTFAATFIFRIIEGRIVEVWRSAADLSRVRQIGARIVPAEAPGERAMS